MGVPVDDQIGAGAIDGVAEEGVAEERVELQSLAVQGPRHGCVVEEHETDVADETAEDVLQRRPPRPRRGDPVLHLWLAEVVSQGRAIATAEALGAGDGDSLPGDVEHDAAAIEHVDTGSRRRAVMAGA